MRLKNRNGFLLLEFVIAVAILGVIVSVGAPISARMYRGFVVEREARQFVNVLRLLETRVFTRYRGAAHGVRVASGTMIVFQGDSYHTRRADFDEIRKVAVNVAGPAEVVFYAGTGFPNATGTWVFSDAASAREVVLNAFGTVFYE